jgi:hypothetical protein
MPKSFLRLSWVAIALVLLLWVPQAVAITPTAIEPYLIAGKLAQGEAAMLAQLQNHPEDDQARFSLGVTQLLSSVERLSQSLYRYGLRQTSVTRFLPVLRLPIPENPNPQTIRYADTRQVLQTFVDDLAKIEATLASIKDPNVKLPLRFGLIKLDLNADGKVEAGESFWRIFESLNRTGITESKAQAFSIAFDAGDAVWLRGYTHLLSAGLEFALAHDGQLFFNTLAHLMFEKPETPYPFLVTGRSQNPYGNSAEITDLIAFFHLLNFPMQEPARMTKSLQHLQAVTALSRQSWQLIQAETDRDREWLPNPQQTSVIFNTRVTTAMIESWMAFLDEADALLLGKNLIPFWRSTEARGVNLNKVFTQPRSTDVILWIQGTGAVPYLEFGKVTQPQLWQRLQETFGGQFFGFAAWFN